MNKLLRNPWVVMALVVGMAALWWVQMRSLWMPGGVAESSSPIAITAEVALDTAVPDTGASEPLILALEPNKPTELRWDKVPARDPFGPTTAVMPTPPVPASEDAVSVPAPVVAVLEPTLALEAVLNTPSAQIAVIDGRIVRVGDKVGGRAVLRIDNASVALGSSVLWPQPLVLKLPNR